MDASNDLIQRLEVEISKYMDISTIFKRLREYGFLQHIHQIFYQIFNNEHEYTIKELYRMKDNDQFNIAEHYKMNSHIFKQNLTIISNIVIDDLWVNFNTLVLEQQHELSQRQALDPISELSTEQFDFEPQPVNKALIHVQEYRDQLNMINQMRKPKSSPGDIANTSTGNRVNQSRSSNNQNSTSKTPSMTEGLTPSQQNQRTMQYLSQFVRDNQPITKPSMSFLKQSGAKSPKDLFDQHVSSIQVQDQFSSAVRRQKSAKKS